LKRRTSEKLQEQGEASQGVGNGIEHVAAAVGNEQLVEFIAYAENDGQEDRDDPDPESGNACGPSERKLKKMGKDSVLDKMDPLINSVLKSRYLKRLGGYEKNKGHVENSGRPGKYFFGVFLHVHRYFSGA
jgi:hypothetical protein